MTYFWWGGHKFVGDLVAKWPHLFVIKFVYWWWNVCILCISYMFMTTS